MTIDFSAVKGADQVASGFRYTGYTTSQETVQLAGRREVVNQMERIRIPEDELDVTGASETIEKDIDLAAFLPEGVEIVGPSTIHVSLNIAPVTSTTLSYVTERLQWIGADQDHYLYEMTDVAATIPLVITGFEEDPVDELRASDFELSLDVSGLTAGDYDVPVNTESLKQVSPGLELVSPRTVHVSIIERRGAEDADNAGNGS